jgi:hypothetical protein
MGNFKLTCGKHKGPPHLEEALFMDVNSHPLPIQKQTYYILYNAFSLKGEL